MTKRSDIHGKEEVEDGNFRSIFYARHKSKVVAFTL
jgi:hypothetical protein